MNFKSQKGYSLVEVGVGLILISIFMACAISMLSGTTANYRLIEQKNVAMSYLIKAVEFELMGVDDYTITDSDEDTRVVNDDGDKKTTVTKIKNYNLTVTTTVENLPPKNGESYDNSRVKILTGTVQFYTKKSDPSSKRTIELKTLKVEEGGV